MERNVLFRVGGGRLFPLIRPLGEARGSIVGGPEATRGLGGGCNEARAGDGPRGGGATGDSASDDVLSPTANLPLATGDLRAGDGPTGGEGAEGSTSDNALTRAGVAGGPSVTGGFLEGGAGTALNPDPDDGLAGGAGGGVLPGAPGGGAALRTGGACAFPLFRAGRGGTALAGDILAGEVLRFGIEG